MPAIPWEWSNPITKSEYTGRMRTRVQSWTRKLVLQVELKRTRISAYDKSEVPAVTGIEHMWIDADHNDVARYIRADP